MSLSTRLSAVAALAGLGLSLSVGLGAPAALADTTAPVAQYRGAQLHLMWGENTATDITRQLDMLAATGSDSGRLDVAWSSLQDSGPGTFANWYVTKLDSVVNGASARGIKLILTLLETPCWASSAPDTLKQSCSGAYWDRGVTHYPPTNPADYATAARFLAQRYGSQIAALEVWNEPNWNNGTTTPNLVSADMPGAYVAMLKPAYAAVKAVAPDLPVLAAAMSFSDVPFLQALYARGARGSYDGISVHPYNEWRPVGAPHDPAWAKYDFVQGLTALHTAMLNAGDTTPVWITEMGWTSCATAGGTDRWCVTEQQQADYIPGAFTLAATWPWVRSLIVYNLRSKSGAATDTEANFGLVNHDYSVKPALASFTTVVTSLRTAATTPVPVTTTTTTDPAPVVTSTTTTVTSGKPRRGGRLRLTSNHRRLVARLSAARLHHQHQSAAVHPTRHLATASRAARTIHPRLEVAARHHVSHPSVLRTRSALAIARRAV